MMLSPKSLGLAGGILKGLGAFFFTLLSVYTGYAHDFLSMVPAMWPGYSVSVGGSVIGLIYGFIEGFFWLALLAWLYNKFVGRSSGCCTTDRPKDWK